MAVNRLCWRVGGQAGDGIMTVGHMFARACTRGGLQVSAYTEFPSLVRGGHNNYWVHVEDRPAYSPRQRTDLLVALNRETVDKHKDTLSENSAVIYDPESVEIKEGELGKNVMLVPIPLMKIAKEQAGNRIYRNSVAVGASLGLVDYDFTYIQEVVTDTFKKKGQNVVDENIKAAKLGHEAAESLRKDFSHTLKIVKNAPPRMLISGTEAITFGAVQAGCKFYSTYPMTPSSEILHTFAKLEEEHSIVVKQTEDEIAGLVMALGASFTGVRSMAGTSGGGFALMTEALSMAAEAELPVVVAVISRPGPSTGMPTWTAQGDLRMVAHAGHGEFPRIVMAPGDLEEAFHATFETFNLAEKYRLPAIILSDKLLCMSFWSQDIYDTKNLKIDRGKFLSDKEVAEMAKKHGRSTPYLVTKNGVPPRWIPGQPKGGHTGSGNEHNIFGDVDDTAENRIEQMEKRWRKADSAMKEIPKPKLYGPKDAKATLFCWGSTKLACLEAIRMLEEENIPVNCLHTLYILPFPTQIVGDMLDKANKSIIIEGNYDGQFAGMVKQFTGKEPDELFLKFDGRPIYPEEIVQRVKAMLGGGE